MSFLRLKRKNEEDPKDLLILKKHKLQDDNSPVFELTNSSVSQEDINNVIVNTLKNRTFKNRQFDIVKSRERIRTENIKHTKNSRFKLISILRKFDDSVPEVSVPIIDVNDGEESEHQNNYVYDLYYSNASLNLNDPDFADNYSVHEFDDNKWDIERETDSDLAEDEDDSNDENNWRNDYPEDESSMRSDDDEEYLCHRMKKTQISSDYSLSSDEYDEDIFSPRVEKEKYLNYYDDIASDASDDDD